MTYLYCLCSSCSSSSRRCCGACCSIAQCIVPGTEFLAAIDRRRVVAPAPPCRQAVTPGDTCPQGYLPRGYLPRGYLPRGYLAAAASSFTHTGPQQPPAPLPCRPAAPTRRAT